MRAPEASMTLPDREPLVTWPKDATEMNTKRSAVAKYENIRRSRSMMSPVNWQPSAGLRACRSWFRAKRLETAGHVCSSRPIGEMWIAEYQLLLRERRQQILSRKCPLRVGKRNCCGPSWSTLGYTDSVRSLEKRWLSRTLKLPLAPSENA